MLLHKKLLEISINQLAIYQADNEFDNCNLRQCYRLYPIDAPIFIAEKGWL